MNEWKSVPCPKCNRKGLHYADHPHAQGWKDYSKLVCRFCHQTFTLKDKPKMQEKL